MPGSTSVARKEVRRSTEKQTLDIKNWSIVAATYRMVILKVNWEFEDQEIDFVKKFVEDYSDNTIIKNRMSRNLKGNLPPVNEQNFWSCLVNCLVSTQQRSGPNSRVAQFLSSNSKFLDYNWCINYVGDFQAEIQQEYKGLGLRRNGKLAVETNSGLNFIKQNWITIKRELEALKNIYQVVGPQLISEEESGKYVSVETKSANFLAANFRGIGLKQSRNLLQMFGLIRYEIPLDSRITKWLREQHFPFEITGAGLGDPGYYAFISGCIQDLCQKCKIYPCILDGAIFVSFDGNEKWKDVEDVYFTY